MGYFSQGNQRIDNAFELIKSTYKAKLRNFK